MLAGDEGVDDAYDVDMEVMRARNRKKLKELAALCFYYCFSFYALFAAFYLPLQFKQFGVARVLDLGNTRLPLSGSVPSEKFMWIAIVLALALYIPCWLTSVKFADFVARIWHRYREVTAIRHGAFITIGMFLFAFLVAGHWIYVLYPRYSYLSSVATPFLAIFLIAGFASSRK